MMEIWKSTTYDAWYIMPRDKQIEKGHLMLGKTEELQQEKPARMERLGKISSFCQLQP